MTESPDAIRRQCNALRSGYTEDDERSSRTFFEIKECAPSSPVSRQACTISGSRTMSSIEFIIGNGAGASLQQIGELSPLSHPRRRFLFADRRFRSR